METQVDAHFPLKKFLAIAVKTHAKADIKVFWSCPILRHIRKVGPHTEDPWRDPRPKTPKVRPRT